MGSPIGTTMDDLCRHRMVINVTCLTCGRVGDLPASKIRNDRNRTTEFRRLRYHCQCGSRRVKVYAYPADWR